MIPEQPIQATHGTSIQGGDNADQTPPREISERDQELLIQMRKDYTFFLDYWRRNRDEAEIDMNYAAANGWTAADKADREGRPCLWPDELSQYIKQTNNNLRQNKTEIVVKPKGEGATDEDAERREDIMRGIQYSSTAQAAYTTAFESAAWCGFGAYRVITEEVGRKGEQHPKVKRIPNWATVLWDPEAKEADFSDQETCFVTDSIRLDAFKRKYPKAVKTSFTREDQNMAPDWFHGENVILAEYWRVLRKGDPDFKEGSEYKARPDICVMQYITNGVEILERNEWSGSWIPIIGVFGEEIYVNEGGQAKRLFMSLIRRARVPQKMLAYLASQEAEEFQMSPRTPFVGYAGTFKDWETTWAYLNKVARAYVEVDVPQGWNDAWGPPPLPTRPQFIPQAQAYELSRESWRRAIQAAMGLTPLPTAAQQRNEKSGKALERIQTEQAVGSFHVVDNFYRSLENCGRQLNELITILFETPRQVASRNQTGEHTLMRVIRSGDEAEIETLLPGAQANDYLVSDRGEFDVTISEGPSRQSQRDAQTDFADLMVSEIPQVGQFLPPGTVPKALAQAIKLKNIGPEGDALAEILDPPPDQQVNPAMLQQQVQTLNAQLQEAGVLVQKYEQERAGKVIENQTKVALEKIKQFSESERFSIEQVVKLAVAEISTKAQNDQQRQQMLAEFQQLLHQGAHEIGMQKDQQAYEAQQAQMAQAAAQQQAQVSPTEANSGENQ